MRIIAGSLKSRTVKSVPGETTRPTTDKVKEALYNTIGPYFDGGMMLDVFAGSGSVAFEALSRGMAQAVCIDRAYQAIRTIRENAVSLQVMEQIELIKGNYPTALKQISGKYQFDLVFIDPPYRLDIIEEMTDLLNAYQLLKEHAWLIFEVAKETASAERYNGIIKVKEASYGISKLLYYQKEDL